MQTKGVLTEKGKNDLRLVNRAIYEKDQEAFTSLYNCYYKPVFYMLYKMTGNNKDAEELTIVAFGKAFTSLERYVPSYAFSTWLFRIATNTCIDFMRKRSQQHIVLEFEEAGTQELTKRLRGKFEDDPEEDLIKKQRAAILRSAVSKLKPRYRRVIELKYLKEKSLDEIVEMLSLPAGTIKAQLHRGRELLYNEVNVFRELI